MKTLYGYVGRLGSGKNYHMLKTMEQLKDSGNVIYMISFADPIKQILKNSFGFTKNGKLNTNTIPTLSEIYVKKQIVDSFCDLISNLKYEKFEGVSELDLKSYILNNYEKYEKEFYNYIWGAITGYDVINRIPMEYNYAFRRLAQMLGTELGRFLIDSIWVDIAINKVISTFKQNLADFAFIADVRFVNEYHIIRNFKNTTIFSSDIYGVVASNETRAKRRNLSLEDLILQDNHGSEKEIDDIIKLLPTDRVIQND